MVTDWLKYLWQFVLLCLLQVLIFNNLNLGGYINPFPYIYFILMLPISTGRVPVLFLGFLIGLTVDVFSNTGGMHAAASTLVAFYRPLYLKAQSPREGYEVSAMPHIKHFGMAWYLPYVILLVTMHHTALFFLEAFRFSDFFHTLLKAALSTALTVVIIVFIEYMFVNIKRR